MSLDDIDHERNRVVFWERKALRAEAMLDTARKALTRISDAPRYNWASDLQATARDALAALRAAEEERG